jgi:hypothetical protein
MKGIMEGYLDLSGAYATDTGLRIATGAGKPVSRPLVNDAVILVDCNLSSRVTFNHAWAQTAAGAGTETEAELLSEACLGDSMDHAEPFAFDDTKNWSASVSSEQCAMVKLLKILEDMNCPDYALGSILDWALEAYMDGFTFAPTVKSRDGVLAGLYKYVHNATLLLPSVVPVDLIGAPGFSDMIVYDFAAQWLSLLHSSELMRWEKLNINPANPFAMYESPDGLLGEVHSGAMYKALYAKHITDPQRQLLTPCMLYFDKCHITNGSGRFGLEPATMTSTLFTEQACRSPIAYRVLGFIHQLMKSTAENTKQANNANVINYHRQLNILFEGLRQVQSGIDRRLQNDQATPQSFQAIAC